MFNPLSPHDALKHHFTSPKTDSIFLQPKVLRTKISMKLVYQYMAIFFIFNPHQIIFIHYKSRIATANTRLVVDEDDNGKSRLQKVTPLTPEQIRPYISFFIFLSEH